MIYLLLLSLLSNAVFYSERDLMPYVHPKLSLEGVWSRQDSTAQYWLLTSTDNAHNAANKLIDLAVRFGEHPSTLASKQPLIINPELRNPADAELISAESDTRLVVVRYKLAVLLDPEQYDQAAKRAYLEREEHLTHEQIFRRKAIQAIGSQAMSIVNTCKDLILPSQAFSTQDPA